MKKDLQHVLDNWGVTAQLIEPIAVRENQIYRVKSNRGQFALKIARLGYQSREALETEFALLAHLERQGFEATRACPTQTGEYLVDSELGFASLLHWIDGAPFGQAGGAITRDDAAFSALGKKMALFHTIADGWQPPHKNVRPSWGREGLLGDAPFWGRFWENPSLSSREQRRLEDFRNYAFARLPLDEALFIHADLVPENILVTGDKLTFIDFDDFGAGFALFDIATAFLKIDQDPKFQSAKTALLDGYISIRPLDLSQLELFMAIRACTYLGWIMARPELDPDGKRVARYRDHAFQKLDLLEVFS